MTTYSWRRPGGGLSVQRAAMRKGSLVMDKVGPELDELEIVTLVNISPPVCPTSARLT